MNHIFHRRSPSALWRTFFAALLVALYASPSTASMVAMDETELENVSGQGLFWSDKITGSELAGSNAYSTPFTFYRMGLDGELALNANLGKMQLGCGGVNDFINAPAACDIDIDYASLMGRNGTNPGNPLSSFKLTRPYLELAIKNDGTANREIVGLKIGAQAADGAITSGRRYTVNGAVNQENSLGWSEPTNANTQPVRTAGANCNTGASVNSGVLGCHSGINSVSGFLGAEMSISLRVQGRVCVFICIGLDAWGCTGRTTFGGDNCGTAKGDALFVDMGGTRMQGLGLRSALLNLNDGGVLTSIITEGYASLNLDLRLVHKLTFDNGGDFGISFQREPVAYPRYSKMTPTAEMTANGTYPSAMDACATANYDTTRCASAYAVPTNTGWWLNAPQVKLLDVINPSINVGDLSLGDALALFGAPGLVVNQGEFNMTPYKNCYGAARFC